MRAFSVLLFFSLLGCCAAEEPAPTKEQTRERVSKIVSEFLDADQGGRVHVSTEQLLQIWPGCAGDLMSEIAQRPYRRGTVTPEEYDRLMKTASPPEILVRILALNVFAHAKPEEIAQNHELRQLLRAIALDDVMPNLRAQAMSILLKRPSSEDLELLVVALRDGGALRHGGTVADVAQQYLERLLEGIEGLPAHLELPTQKERDAAAQLWTTWWRNRQGRMEFDPESERFRQVAREK